MKKMRKGFTLVELLVVVTIIATLTASMTLSVTGSTAKAKAAVIASNVEACKKAAAMYCADHMDDGTDISTITTSVMLNAYIGTWDDFNSGNIKYATAADSEMGYKAWYITVDFTGDGDVANIKTELAKIKGFGDYGKKIGGDGDDKDDPAIVVRTGKFKVMLWNGAVTSES